MNAHSSYTSRWWGPRLGADADFALSGGWTLSMAGWREWVDYEANADWALREAFSHPESFTHLADGHITGLQLGLSRPWRKNGRLSLVSERVRGRVGPGTDITHFGSLGDLSTALNEVVWDSDALRLSWRWAL